MKNSLVQRKIYQDSGLEADIEQQMSEATEDAKAAAREHAAKKQPPISGTGILMAFVGLISASFEAIMAFAAQHLQSKTLLADGAAVIDNLNREITRVEQALRDARQVHQGADRALKCTAKVLNMLRRTLWGWILLVVLFFAEMLLNLRAFQEVGESLLSCLLLALALSVGIHVVAYFMPVLINKVKKPVLRILLVCGVALAMLTVFVVVGWIRIRAGSEIPMVVFVILNSFLFAAVALVVHFILPSKNDRTAHRQWCEKNAACEAAKSIINELEAKRQSLESEKFEALQTRTAHLAYAEDISRRIQSQCRRAIELYKQENAFSRNDGVPACFTDVIPEIEPITFYFNNYNNEKSE